MTPGSDDALATHELDLVTRASKGDAEAFDRFYERNAGGVQLLVERLLGPGPVADTVVLEAFEKTIRRLPLLGARNSSPRLYVLTTARNGAYAALGRERPAAPQGPVAALLSLPSRQRELLALRELGLGETECAEVAGIEPAEVGVQIARGRLRLTDALEDASLSGVFAEPRAERLLAAEVVRQEGASLPPELEQEITQLADSDARFAAALSAVRSPSRSVGQLPPATGASRLGAIARERIVTAGAAGAAGAIAASAAEAAPAPAPTRPAARTSDPYDAEIGDEAAWGIVDDDEADEPAPAAPAPPADGPEPTGAPSQESWGAGTAEPTGPTRIPASAAPEPAAAAAAAATGGEAPVDDLAGWDALDWDEDDKQWTAGPDAAPTAVAPIAAHDPTAGAPIAATPGAPEPHDPDQTRAFDVVAAGLADPDDEAAVTTIAPGPPAGFDFGGGDTDEPIEHERRSPWRFLLWLIGFALLFAGVAFAAYTWREARDNPDAPPASTIQPTTSTAPADEKVTPTTGSSKSRSGSSSDTKKSTSSSGSTKSSSGSSSSSSSSSTSKSSSGSTSSGSTGGASSSGGASTGGNTSSGGSTTQDQTVSGGEETSGGSVRGDAGTTP